MKKGLTRAARRGPGILLLALLLALPAGGWGLREFYRLPEVRQVKAAFAATEIQVSAIWYGDLDIYREIRLKREQLP